MVSTKGGALDGFLRLRLTNDQLNKIDSIANGLNVTRSAALRELIDVAVPTGQPRLLIGAQKGGAEVENGD